MATQLDKNGKNIGISWCHHTVNLWWGCTKVHAGCDNCYAEKLSARFNNGENGLWGIGSKRKRIKSAFRDLAKFQRKAKKLGEIHRVFVGSMMDIFEKSLPLINPIDGGRIDGGYQSTGDLRARFFADLEHNEYPNLQFLLLTKRPSNINKYYPEELKENPPQNVIIGCSPVDQATYDRMSYQMLWVTGRKFLSIEPQLGPIRLHSTNTIDWIIQGGESGPNKRPFDLEWANMMREQCKSLNIPYFFKQIDKVQVIPKELLVREFPKLG